MAGGRGEDQGKENGRAIATLCKTDEIETAFRCPQIGGMLRLEKDIGQKRKEFGHGKLAY